MSLKDKTINGVGWNGLGNFIKQIMMLLSLVIMARYLTPNDFGVYSILMIFVGFMNIFASMGTSQLIIHLDKPSHSMLSSIFFFNICIGIVLYGLLYVLAWPISIYFDNADLVNLLQIIALIFIITTAGLVQKALLEKSMLYKHVIIIETISVTISTILGIVAVIYGLGIYSLILLALSNAGFETLGLWLNSKWKPAFRLSKDDLKQIWAYSFDLTGFSIINYFARASDNFLIGKYINAQALGVYSMAYKIMLYPIISVSHVLSRVLFPAFSEVKDDNIRFKKGYLKGLRYIAIITFPLMLGLMATANNFVVVVFGDKWSGMIILLVIFSPVGLIQSIVTTVGSIYMAKGSTRLMFKIGIINSIVTVIFFIVGISFGLEMMAICYLVANLIMLYPNLNYAWKQINLKVFEGYLNIAPFLYASLIMSICVYYTGFYLNTVILSVLIIFVIQVALGILFYGVFLYLFYRNIILDMMNNILKIRNSKN